MVLENSSINQDTSMKDNGRTIWLMEEARPFTMMKVNTMENSLYDEKEYPKIKDITKTKTVEAKAKLITIKNLDFINSFLLSPSIKFCFNVPFVYSFAIIDTIIMARNILNKEAI